MAPNQLGARRQRLGIGRRGHRHLVLVALLALLERDRHVEDRAPALPRDDVTRRERLAVADAVDGEDDRHARIAGTQEIAVQRMREQPRRGARRCDQRLRRHLPAEETAGPRLLVAAAEDVEIDVLEIEEIEEIVERIFHAYSSETIWPSRTSSRNGRLRASPSAPIDVTPETPG